MALYTNVGGVTKEIKGLYGHVNGATRKLNSMWTNVGGVSKRVFNFDASLIYAPGQAMYGLHSTLNPNAVADMVAIYPSYIFLQAWDNTSGYNPATVSTREAIDFGAGIYQSLIVEFTGQYNTALNSELVAMTSPTYQSIGVPSNTTSYGRLSVYQDESKILTVNVSNVTGNQYVVVGGVSESSFARIQVYKIYLVPKG